MPGLLSLLFIIANVWFGVSSCMDIKYKEYSKWYNIPLTIISYIASICMIIFIGKDVFYCILIFTVYNILYIIEGIVYYLAKKKER